MEVLLTMVPSAGPPSGAPIEVLLSSMVLPVVLLLLLSGPRMGPPTVMLRRVVALLSGSQVVTPTVMLRRVVSLLSGSQLVTPTVLLRRV